MKQIKKTIYRTSSRYYEEKSDPVIILTIELTGETDKLYFTAGGVRIKKAEIITEQSESRNLYNGNKFFDTLELAKEQQKKELLDDIERFSDKVKNGADNYNRASKQLKEQFNTDKGLIKYEKIC